MIQQNGRIGWSIDVQVAIYTFVLYHRSGFCDVCLVHHALGNNSVENIDYEYTMDLAECYSFFSEDELERDIK